MIGLDGVPYSLISRFALESKMPFLAEFMENGALQLMKASLPEISAVSWSDFMTGSNAGTHGIFGFTDFKSDSYEIRFPNFLDLKCPTFWDKLAEKGKRCVIINQPSTYPARPVNGILISGFVALDLAKAVYPLSHKAILDKIGYQIDIDTLRARHDPDFLWQELKRTLIARQKAFHQFWREDWDYFELVITETDRLHHFLWDACLDPNHPNHQRFLNYYQDIDRFIQNIVAAFEQLTGGLEGFYLLSDHGFCGIDQEVYLNAWLKKESYLKFKANEPKGIEDLAEGSLAFALDPNRIYLNKKGRFPQGVVDPLEAEALKKEISQKIEKLEWQGKKVIRHVFDAEKIYSGPFVALGPDLVVVAEPGFDLKGSVKKKELFGQTDLQGMHTWNDAFVWSPHRLTHDLAISDLAASILMHFQG